MFRCKIIKQSSSEYILPLICAIENDNSPTLFLLFLQVFHKIITTGHQRLQPLFDCLLTIVVNGKKIGTVKFELWWIKT